MKAPSHSESHHEIICPNCGFHADHNYCAQCGQETHLHNESFGSMILHFVGHYFHYDSKFWRTLKTLWTKPGELTLAYLRKERMRFIPPISLYIFLSFVFFLVAFSFGGGHNPGRKGLHEIRKGIDSAANGTDTVEEKQEEAIALGKKLADSIGRLEMQAGPGQKFTLDTSKKGAFQSFLEKKWDRIKEKHGDRAGEYIKETVEHNFPKVFFFLIPVVALFLKLLFLRRKSAFFSHHAVFSLHVHSFFFSILLLFYINPIAAISGWLGFLIFIWGGLYFIKAMKRVYLISTGRALLYSLLISFGYVLAFTIGMLGILMLVFVS